MTVQLHILNPGKKKRRAAKKGGKKRSSTKAKKARSKPRRAMARKKKSTRKRKGTVARAVQAVKRRVRKAVANPGHKRRRRRRNPSARGMLMNLKKGLPNGKELVGIGGAVLAVSAGTKFFADGAPVFAGSGPTSLAGEPWNAKQYAAAIGLSLIGGPLLDRFVRGSGHAFTLTGIVFTIAKTVMPLAMKVQTLQKFLGEAEGDVRVDEDGQSWILQGGRWNALQGLVNATAMDGLEEQNALDGLVEATPMDGYYEDSYGITTSDISVNRP